MKPRRKLCFESWQSAQAPAKQNQSRTAGRAWPAVLLGRLAVSALLVAAPRVLEAQTNGTVRFLNRVDPGHRFSGWAQLNVDWRGVTSPAGVTVRGSGGTLREGVDYSIDSPTLVWPERQFNLTSRSGRLNGAQATIELNLVNPTGGVAIGQPEYGWEWEQVMTAPARMVLALGIDSSVKSFNLPPGDWFPRLAWKSYGQVQIRVERQGPLGESADIGYYTTPGTAQPGVDYASLTGTLHFDAGVNEASFIVPILTNSPTAGDVQFEVMLTNQSAGYLLGSPNAVTVRIRNDAVGFALQPHSETNAVFDPSTYLAVPENFASALVDVLIVGDTTTRPASVEYRTEPITAMPVADYTPVSGTLTFAAGESRKTVAIPITNDSITDWQESFWLLLQNPAGGLPLSRPRELEIGITDNDRGYFIADTNGDSLGVLVLDERAGTVTVNVNRVGDYNFPSSVLYRVATDGVHVQGGSTYRLLGSAVAGVDFVPTEGTLNYAPNETNKTFTLTVLDDGMIAGDKLCYITLDQATGGVGIQNSAVQVVIRDCERNPARIDPDFQPEWPSQGAWDWQDQLVVGPSDGKIYLLTPANRMTGEDGVLALRLLPDGLPDPVWRPAAINGWVAGLALQTNGQLLVAASRNASGFFVPEFSVNGVARRHLARLNADGSLDTTFAVSFPTNLWVLALALQDDGRILTLMWDRSAIHNVVFRLLSSGAVDPAFSSPALSFSGWSDSITATPDGGVILRVCPGGRLNPDGSADQQFQPPSDSPLLALQPDGRLLATVTSSTNGDVPHLARLTPEGQLDPTFKPVRLYPDLLQQVLPTADGKLWVLTEPQNWLKSDYRLTRRLADGSDDPTWPAAGLQVTSGWLWSFDDPGTAVRLKSLPDGNLLLVSSRFGWVNGQWRASLARLLVNAPLPRFEVDAASARVPENAGKAPITLLRCGTNTEPITVTWRTEGGTARPDVDYVPASGTLTFPVHESSATIELEVLDNAVPDADRTVRLRFQSPPPVNPEYPPVELTIVNDDPGFAPGAIKRFPNGRVWLRGTGLSGWGEARIEASENLRDWHDLGPEGPTQIYPGLPETIDVGAPTNMARFYRLRGW